MFRNYAEIEEFVLESGFKATVALAASHDDDALNSVVTAKRKGIIKAILIGDEQKTKELLREMKDPEEDYQFINELDNAAAVRTAVRLVNQKDADMPMKGLMPTAVFLRGILDKEQGFVPDKGLISVANIYQITKEDRLLILTDCAINIEPDYAAKVKILNNSVKLAHQLGIECPKVAVVAPVEVINPAMQSTIDAAMLSKANERGQIRGCIVDGPLGLDNAVSAEAAHHKGIISPVAGQPDLILFPELASANMFSKGIIYFGDGSPSCGVAVGTTVPVIMTSRSDTAVNKYNSILIGALQTIRKDVK